VLDSIITSDAMKAANSIGIASVNPLCSGFLYLINLDVYPRFKYALDNFCEDFCYSDSSIICWILHSLCDAYACLCAFLKSRFATISCDFRGFSLPFGFHAFLHWLYLILAFFVASAILLFHIDFPVGLLTRENTLLFTQYKQILTGKEPEKRIKHREKLVDYNT
jgi:hypothetical protein